MGGYNTAFTARDFTGTPFVLSGDIDQNAPDKVYNSFHVVITSDVDSTTVIDGFTIIGGNANGSDLNSIGGGMFNENSSPTITNTIS